MNRKAFHIGAALLLTLAATLPLHSAPRQGGKPAKKAKPVKPSAQEQCESNLKQLGLAAFQFTVGDNEEHFPDLSSPAKIKSQLKPYVKSEAVFRCPLGHVYQGNKSLSNKLNYNFDTWEIVMFYEPKNAHGGKRFVAYASGAVALLTPAQWEQAKRKSGIK